MYPKHKKNTRKFKKLFYSEVKVLTSFCLISLEMYMYLRSKVIRFAISWLKNQLNYYVVVMSQVKFQGYHFFFCFDKEIVKLLISTDDTRRYIDSSVCLFVLGFRERTVVTFQACNYSPFTVYIQISITSLTQDL